jgi:hypothetical protein
MFEDWSDASLLQQLEDLAARLEIRIRYENLADDELFIQSGGCKILGRHLIIIDPRCAIGARARILGRELSKYNLEDVYILPRVREFISLQASFREKNRPQT